MQLSTNIELADTYLLHKICFGRALKYLKNIKLHFRVIIWYLVFCPFLTKDMQRIGEKFTLEIYSKNSKECWLLMLTNIQPWILPSKPYRWDSLNYYHILLMHIAQTQISRFCHTYTCCKISPCISNVSPNCFNSIHAIFGHVVLLPVRKKSRWVLIQLRSIFRYIDSMRCFSSSEFSNA